MKFVCDRCQTRYSIADEKVRQRILRIRCKNCGSVITVQSGEIVPGPQDPTGRLEVGGWGSTPPVASSSPSKVSLTPSRPNEWFVAVDGVEKGPLSCGEAARFVVSLKSEQSVHVWKEGMDGWKRPKDVAILAQEISALSLLPSGSSPHTPIAAARGGSSTVRRLASPPADSAVRRVVSGTRPKPPPPGGSGSGPKLPQPGATGSGPRPSPPLAGSGLKTVPPIVAGSGLRRAPPPIPGSGIKRAPPPIPGSGPKAVPSGTGSRRAPAPVSAESVPGGLLSRNGPALPGLTRSDLGHPALQAGSDKAATAGPDKRPSRVHDIAVVVTPAPVMVRPSVSNQPVADDEFEKAKKTPLPGASLPPVASLASDQQKGANWPPPPLTHPSASQDPLDPAAAMNLPAAPPPSAGSLFGNVGLLPAPLSRAAHVEAGLSKLTGLAGLAYRHRHLKYVVAASVVVILVILVILVSWRGEAGKAVPATLEHAARAPEPPSLVEAEPPPSHDEPMVAPEAAHKGRTAGRGASKRSSHPAAPSSKPAAVGNDPFEGPYASSRTPERPVPVQLPGQARGARPPGLVKEISQSQIAAVVHSKENQAGVKTCYERALRRDGRLRTGRLDITVSIGEGGTVQRVQVHGPSDFLIIDSCLKTAIRHWHFPANAEDYATSFPLILQGG